VSEKILKKFKLLYTKDNNSGIYVKGKFVKVKEFYALIDEDKNYLSHNWVIHCLFTKYKMDNELGQAYNYIKFYNGNAFTYKENFIVGFKDKNDGEKFIEGLECLEVMNKLLGD